MILSHGFSVFARFMPMMRNAERHFRHTSRHRVASKYQPVTFYYYSRVNESRRTCLLRPEFTAQRANEYSFHSPPFHFMPSLFRFYFLPGSRCCAPLHTIRLGFGWNFTISIIIIFFVFFFFFADSQYVAARRMSRLMWRSIFASTFLLLTCSEGVDIQQQFSARHR